MNNQTEEILRKRYWQALLLTLLLIFFFFLFARRIDLAATDLGRHLTNGKIFFQTGLIHGTNLYSYTNADFPFVNHHWLFGVLFFPIERLLGFTGISVVFFFLNLTIAGLILVTVTKRTNFALAIGIFLLGSLLSSTRIEIRPEIISYLFIVAYYLILDRNENSGPTGLVYLLPFGQIFWVNTHIYFPFGLFLIFSYILDELHLSIKKRHLSPNAKTLVPVFLISIAVSLINPAGLTGALYPLEIFRNYGYNVAENQSPWIIEKLISFPPNLYFYLFLFVFLVSWIYRLKKRTVNPVSPSEILISAALLYFSFKAIRNFPLLSCLGSLLIAANLSTLRSNPSLQKIFHPKKYFLVVVFYLLFCFVLFMVNKSFWSFKETNWGFGLRTDNLNSLNFFRENKLSGPIFNNYDLGSYLIWGLYPQEKVFVDNRPEAYPSEFFQKTYIPMQENTSKWKEVDQKYGFNLIFYYRHDLTPWAQKFLIDRINDLDWAPVYVDEYTIILLKRNAKNRTIIEKYEIPKESFTVKPDNF